MLNANAAAPTPAVLVLVLVKAIPLAKIMSESVISMSENEILLENRRKSLKDSSECLKNDSPDK
jgi:hypothetical protein